MATTPPKKQLVIGIKIEGLRETLKAFNDLPRDAKDELRDEAGIIASDMAEWIKSAALADSRQSALLADTVKVVRDRVPAVTIGGSKRVGKGTGRRKGAAWQILFGANFGARGYAQFRPWAGKGQDYFVFKNIDEHAGEIESRWLEAADRIIREWENSRGEV